MGQTKKNVSFKRFNVCCVTNKNGKCYFSDIKFVVGQPKQKVPSKQYKVCGGLNKKESDIEAIQSLRWDKQNGKCLLNNIKFVVD